MKAILILIVIGIGVGGYYLLKPKKLMAPPSLPVKDSEQTSMEKENLILTSSQFANMGKIPARYTCDGQKLNPPLEISGVLPEAKSLVLIMEDPDVPKNLRPDGMWDHWLRFNLPATLTTIEEGQDPGGVAGITTSKNLNYVPPCPPDREHRYFFKLYSLDAELPLQAGTTKQEILTAMGGHILQQTELIGFYERQ